MCPDADEGLSMRRLRVVGIHLDTAVRILAFGTDILRPRAEKRLLLAPVWASRSAGRRSSRTSPCNQLTRRINTGQDLRPTTCNVFAQRGCIGCICHETCGRNSFRCELGYGPLESQAYDPARSGLLLVL